MEIDELEAISDGEVPQWVRIRSRDANNPVLLLIQQGPGLPMISEARAFERALSLENVFTVVYWDQRGSGLSHRGQKALQVTLGLLVSDTLGLLEHLRERFGGPSLIAGFSIGGTIGLLAAAQRPDLVAAVVAVGMDINGPDADTHAYNFALETAVQQRHRRAERQLRKVGAPPQEKFEQFATRVRWATNFGGVHQRETYGSMVRGLLGSLLRSPDYTTTDLVRTVAGSPRPKRRCCLSSLVLTWGRCCPASTRLSYWCKDGTTKWRRGIQLSTTSTCCRRPAKNLSGSRTQRTCPTSKSRRPSRNYSTSFIAQHCPASSRGRPTRPSLAPGPFTTAIPRLRTLG